MHSRKPTRGEFVAMIVLLAMLLASTYAATVHRSYLAAIVLGSLDLLCLWALVDMLRVGTRPATPFERFEQRQWRRTLLLFVGGGLLVFVAKTWLVPHNNLLLIMIVSLWLSSSIFAMTRLRGRHETSAGYKQRVNYRDPE